MRKSSIWLTIALIAGITGVWWWNKTRQNQRPPSSTVGIGAILPLTGGAAAVGKATLNGIQLAIYEDSLLSKPGRVVVTLKVEDDRADPATGISAFQKLQTIDHLDLILGPLTSGVALAVAPLADRNNVVILSPGASTPALTTAGDFVFRNELSEAFGARAQADLAVDRLKFHNIAMLYVNNEYGVGTAKVFAEEFKRRGGMIPVDEPFAASTTDFRTLLLKIKAANADAIFVVFQDDIVNILKQRHDLGMVTPLYTTPVFEDPGVLKKAGSLAEGVIYTYYGTFDPEAKNGLSGTMAASYQARYGEPAGYYAAQGYDAARIMLSAVRSSADLTAQGIKKALYTISDFHGVTGQMTFDANGDVTKPVSLKTVKEGRFVAF